MSFHSVIHQLMSPRVDMYAGAIFIQQSLHLDLYLAIVGLLAITALYTIAGVSEQGVILERLWPPNLFLAHLLMFPCVKTIHSLHLTP